MPINTRVLAICVQLILSKGWIVRLAAEAPITDAAEPPSSCCTQLFQFMHHQVFFIFAHNVDKGEKIKYPNIAKVTNHKH
ncbi:hypothetical protein [Aliikangiella sp. IMCC44359]|uniref:hypothetical protein n=1 Tax=Aliikangiella sp. IMCC44359 TaxID=3459125 RepID=UPI00403B189D